MLYIGFISASRDHLVWIKNMVEKLYGIKGAIKYSGRSAYHLMYAKHASSQLYKVLYYGKVSCLARKRYKIEQALDIMER